NGVALFVPDVIATAFSISDAKDLSFGGADADREDSQPVGRCFPGRIERARVMIFAVGEQNQHLKVLAFFKGGEGGLNRFGNSGAPFGNHVDVERLDALAERRIINRERALKKSASGKGD